MKDFLIRRRELLVFAAACTLSGIFLPVNAAVVAAVLAFAVYAFRTDAMGILLGIWLMLMFSDSRSDMFIFAASAKVPTVLAGLLLAVRTGKLKLRALAPFRFMLPFILFAMATVPFSGEAFTAFQKIISYATVYAIFPLLTLTVVDGGREQLKDFIWFFSLVLAVGFILYFLHPQTVIMAERYRGLLGNPNGLGITITLIFPLFYLLIEQYKLLFTKSERLIAYALVILSLILSQSRTALLATIIFTLFNYFKALRSLQGGVVFLILVLSFEGIVAIIPTLVYQLGLQEYFRVETLLEGSGRLVAWEFGWNRIKEVFYFGGGFDYTNKIYAENYQYLSLLGHQGNAHNSYLTLWLDTGIVGLVLFAFGLIRLVLQTATVNPFVYPFLYAVLFSANFESWLAGSLNPYTGLFITVMVLASIPIHSETTQSENSE